jgi:hypothetical protein
MNKFLIIFCSILAIIVALHFQGKILLPSDILNYFPAFSQNWTKPHNSLLADPISQFEPWRIYSKNELMNMRLPVWNGLNAGGVPFLATMQSAVFFPLNLLYYLFPPSISLLSISIIKYSLFLFFTFLYLRNFGISKESSAIASFIASASYMVIWLQWPQTNVFLLFPLILFFVERMYKKKNFVDHFFCLSLIYFVAVLGGHPETLFNIAVITSLYILIRTRSGKEFFIHAFGVVFGCFLASFLLIPFLEYLKNSYVISFRAAGVHLLSLPLLSIFSFPFPLILGGPQFSLYKSFSAMTNFAETAAGSIGPIGIIAAFRFWKIRTYGLQFSILIAVCLVFAYLPIISNLPLFSVNANQRFIAFIPLFAAVLIGISIDQIKKTTNALSWKKILLLFIVGIPMLGLFLIQTETKIEAFFTFSVLTMLFMLFTTILFFVVIKLPLRFKNLALATIVLLQIGLPVATFNGLTNKSEYYPQNNLIKTIKKYPSLRILQVGNMNLPPDINLAYGIESAENYDAIDVRGYKVAFDKAFAVKNHLGLVDSVSYESLSNFGIGMVIADYDITQKKIILQPKYNERIVLSRPYSLEIRNATGILSGVRIITESFNRINSCKINFQIVESQKVLQSTFINCKDIRDGMFYTIPVNNIKMEPSKIYQAIFTPSLINGSNQIALRGSSDKPFLELLLSANNKKQFTKVYDKNTSGIYLVNNVKKIDFKGNLKEQKKNNDRVELITESKFSEKLTLKYTFYPGWKAFVNNHSVEIEGKNPFMTINVPKGTNYISFVYKPYSFYIGMMLSTVGFVIVAVYVLRRSLKKRRFLGFGKKIKFSKHVQYFLIGAVPSEIIILLLLKIIPLHFAIPETSAINWFTVHEYPRQQEYIYFFILFLTPLLVGILTWMISIWKKLKK